ncbi:beta-1,3-galactosyl-O-glycosyl-glycoprotein beta-1,6-N-acetylglucosaminyltransferase-like [Mytilus galloprovincialis]|uniref:beta-1,3-galactosyl-O-glycosyl-glycoprotein beta-1,6-N-acetylglucosaminyltransferase-like n=1 Tax=Mytilus galloprovincialis TaxID=29158 RepID=UPI003F7B4B18
MRNKRRLLLVICITVFFSFHRAIQELFLSEKKYTSIRIKKVKRVNEHTMETYTRQTHVSITRLDAHTAEYKFPPFLQINRKVNCRKIVEGDKEEIAKANRYMKLNQPKRITEDDYITNTNNCNNFVNRFGYNAYTVIEEEREFPIAFSILTFKDVDQTERLLRSIYRPHNFYCIHIDNSSSEELHKSLRKIANCLSNVFIVSKTVDVIYDHVSRLRADIYCMTDLLSKSNKWKYFINLPHQQFPLKTNLEMVKILKIYNGANDIEGITNRPRLLSNRFKYSYKYINYTLKRIGLKNGKLPYNANIVKGSAYGVFSREFVKYVIFDKKSKAVLKYMEDFRSPEEYYWATLNQNEVLKAPGRFKGNPEKKPWLAVYASWHPRDRCRGKFVRNICIYGVGDLNELISRKELFANKFYPDYQYLALDCLEEYIHNKTFSPLPFDSFYYRQLPFIRKP